MKFDKKSIMEHKAFLVSFFVIVLVCVYVVFIYIPPFKSFNVYQVGRIELGMTEVDVSLSFGRKSDCQEEEDTENNSKILKYQVGGDGLPSLNNRLCRYNILLRKESNGTYRVKRICFDRVYNAYTPTAAAVMNYEQPRKLWSEEFWVPSTEDSIIKTFGAPSNTSIDTDGVLKLISFTDFNVSFVTKSNEVLQACITNELPLRFADEYNG